MQILVHLKDFYDQQGRLFLPPSKPGEILPSKLYLAYPKEKEARISQVGITSDTTTKQIPGFEDHCPSGVGISSEPLEEFCSRITHDTGIALPQNLDLTSPMAAAVVEALAKHMGIDLTPEALEAEKRRGVAIVVHGSASSGRTTQAIALGDVYQAPVLSLDKVLIRAISSAQTPAGRRAREFCIQAMSVDTSEPPPPPTTSKKQAVVIVKEHPPETTVPPIPPTSFNVDPHEDKDYAVPGGILMSAPLVEDMMADILSERLQQEDCRRGVIMDGIDSIFAPNNHLISTAVILRAFNNRKHIYFVHLDIELQVIVNRFEELEQMRLIKQREDNEKKKAINSQEQARIENLINLDEDEYEALTDEQREEVDALCLQRKRERRELRRLQKEMREREERERREEEERLKELEKKRRGKNKPKVPQLPKNPFGTTLPSRPDSVSSGVMPQISQALSGFAGTSSGVSVTSFMADSPTIGGITPRHKLNKLRKSSAKNMVPASLSEEDTSKLEKLYGQYKVGMEGLRSLLEDWDRQRGVSRPKKLPELEEHPKVTPTRKSRTLKQKDLEIIHITPEFEELSREGLGVPFIEVRASESIVEITEQIMQADLPTPEEILIGMGMGPDGPPIPPSFTFQICPLPSKRRAQEPSSDVYSFIISSPNDP